MKHIAVIGAGWAGCAAAVTLAQAGHAVTLVEAGRTLGGRARRVDIDGKALDNGQHILLGAYGASLKMMRTLGLDIETAMLRVPLQMRYPEGSSGIDFIAPRLPAPLHLLCALYQAGGLSRGDKLALARFFSAMRWMDWRLDTDCTVLELLQRHDQGDRLLRCLWRPLCVAALNTPPQRASARVFLAVLRDSLGARRAASDMLLPRIDLSALLPQAAAAFVAGHGGTVATGAAVKRIERASGNAGWLLHFGNAGNGSDMQRPALSADRIVIATAPEQAATLLGGLSDTGALDALRHEPITTCYLQYAAGTRLPLPFYALLDDAGNGAYGQYVFDRGQLDPAQTGLLAVVVSSSAEAIVQGTAALNAGIAGQLAAAFGNPALATPLWSKTISEKRATFSCTPGLQRPSHATDAEGIFLAGDYTAGDYPATLEAAVRSGVAAASLIA
ncbi:FAD-dependent oxidoreductase [Oxalobacteraceae bacterium CAVE-383]|nr:FAD-dependent oxidoreductase [Oxalobacteraceae bacterium CAVE-383]